MKLTTIGRTALLLTTACVIAGCGGDDGPTKPGGGGGGGGTQTGDMTATVDGVAWTAVSASAVGAGTSVIAIGASDLNGETAIGFAFANSGTGTYAIGPGQVTNANVGDLGGATWMANGAQGGGSITVTSLTAERIAGTFQFTAPLQTGAGTPATRVVTNGVFDVAFLSAP
ncbi:MAG: hypothetical protein GY838_16950 [bacterium]|nr:hypothetical protein [bacterium]